MASDKYAQPDRRPAVVTGASSGIGAATALGLGRGRLPGRAGRPPRTTSCEEVASPDPRGRRRGGRAPARPHRRRVGRGVRQGGPADLGDIEVVVSNAGAVAPGTITEVDPERFARELDLNLVGAHRLVRAFVPGMVERRRGDIVFVSSDVAVRPRPFMSAYSAGKWGLEGMVARAADGARGHRRPRLDRPARPDLERDGQRLGRRRGGVRAQPVGAVRAGPAPALPQAGGDRRRDHDRRQRAARRPPEPHRGQPRGTRGGRDE